MYISTLCICKVYETHSTFADFICLNDGFDWISLVFTRRCRVSFVENNKCNDSTQSVIYFLFFGFVTGIQMISDHLKTLKSDFMGMINITFHHSGTNQIETLTPFNPTEKQQKWINNVLPDAALKFQRQKPGQTV